MILIADSGSTKVHWCLMAANGHTAEFITDGINPLFQTSDAMRNSICNQLLPQMASMLWAGTVSHVFFYGAGCTPEKSPFVEKAIESVFKKAKVFVASDMLGATRGLLGHEKGVACILGTGSNSCLYDGEQIIKNVPSLGFILGDDLKERFLSQYAINQADVIEHVYRQPFPNRWLANLARFCAENIDDPRIHDLVYDHFAQFVKRNISQYYTSEEQKQSMPVGFVGSIAFYYRPVLEQVMSDYGFRVGQILQDPIPGLVEYHRGDVVPTM